MAKTTDFNCKKILRFHPLLAMDVTTSLTVVTLCLENPYKNLQIITWIQDRTQNLLVYYTSVVTLFYRRLWVPYHRKTTLITTIPCLNYWRKECLLIIGGKNAYCISIIIIIINYQIVLVLPSTQKVKS